MKKSCTVTVTPAMTDHGFAPVHLRILPRVELQRQKHLRALLFPALLTNIPTYGRLSAGIASLLQQLENLVPCVPLLARHLSPPPSAACRFAPCTGQALGLAAARATYTPLALPTQSLCAPSCARDASLWLSAAASFCSMKYARRTRSRSSTLIILTSAFLNLIRS